jgi:hypothetical protein
MLDRKVKLIVSTLVLVMLASAIWLVTYTARWSAIPFGLPACAMFVVGAWRWRIARAEGDLSAWTKWSGFVLISYAAICTGFQLMLVMKVMKVIAQPSTLSLMRLLFAFSGVQLLVLGNWMAKLPPLKPAPGMWRPASLALDLAGEAAMLRFGGWIMVGYGLIVVASALFAPMSLIAPLVGSISLATLIVVLVRRRQLHKTFAPS